MQTRSYPPFRIGYFPNSMLPELTTGLAQRVARPRFPSPTSTPLRTLGPELYDTQQPPPLDLAPPPELIPNFPGIGPSHRSPPGPRPRHPIPPTHAQNAVGRAVPQAASDLRQSGPDSLDPAPA